MAKKSVFLCFLLGVLMFARGLSAEQRVFGYLENVLIYPGPFAMEAKLDTGADHSSLHARILTREQRDGRGWIKFEVSNKVGQKAVLEKPVRRTAKVRRHAGRIQERPVVMMEICLGSIKREVQVNLVDRKNLSYKMLIGRSFMAKHAIVNPGARFTAEPKCG